VFCYQKQVSGNKIVYDFLVFLVLKKCWKFFFEWDPCHCCPISASFGSKKSVHWVKHVLNLCQKILHWWIQLRPE